MISQTIIQYCIIVDEVSMVHYFKMDGIFEIIEILNMRGKMVKLVLIGDPFQLPPVATANMIYAYSEQLFWVRLTSPHTSPSPQSCTVFQAAFSSGSLRNTAAPRLFPVGTGYFLFFYKIIIIN
jgi:hypothetical protein